METIKMGTNLKDTVLVLQTFLQALGYDIVVDGDFGPTTDRIVKLFQTENDLVVDGVVGTKSWLKMQVLRPELMEEMTKRFLSESDLVRVAEQLGIELATIKAVNEVESGGTGFILDKPKILFEGHIFWRQLSSRGMRPEDFAEQNAGILFKRANRRSYVGGLEEYKRMDQARLIDDGSGLESASWGCFQVMGFHWKDLNYASVTEFVEKMHENEGAHLDAFARFLEANNLVRHLKNHDWLRFARGYNGRGQQGYDTKIERAYERYKV